MADPQKDDWFVPDAAGAPAAGDDWFVPPSTKTDKIEAVRGAINPGPVARIKKAIGQGEAEGFGKEPLGLSPESQAELSRLGIFHDPARGYVGPQGAVQFLNEAILTPTASGIDAFFRLLKAGISGIGAGAKQAALEAGQKPGKPVEIGGYDVVGPPEAVPGDVEQAGNIALMSHVPERDLMRTAQIAGSPKLAPVLSSPAEIEQFLSRARGDSPMSFDAEIADFIRRKDAGEDIGENPMGNKPKKRLALPPPDDWVVPAESAPPPGPAAPSAIDPNFPDLSEPGRASPPVAPAESAPTGTVQGVLATERPQPPPLDTLLADPRSAPEIAAALDAGGNVGPTPSQNGVNPTPHPKPPSLDELLADPRSAPEIAAQIEASRSPLVPADWLQPPPPPPIAGTPQNPVLLAGPGDVYSGQPAATPTPGQAEAGNYQKRHVTWNGLDVTVETEAGADRRGIGPTGEPWSVTLQHPYGYIKRSKGADGEQVDLYLGPEPQSPYIYVVDQVDPETGAFDEHKVLAGFPDAASARAAYVAGFSDGSGEARLGGFQRLTVDQFKSWLRTSPTIPLAYSDPVAAAKAIADDLGLKPTDTALGAAGRAQRVNNADPTEALITAIEGTALAHNDALMDAAKKQGLTNVWTSHPTPKDQVGEGPAAAGEQPAGDQGQAAPAGEAARSEPLEAERNRGTAAGAAGFGGEVAQGLAEQAKAEGFDTSREFWHGTTHGKFTTFRESTLDNDVLGPAIYLSTKRGAEFYGPGRGGDLLGPFWVRGNIVKPEMMVPWDPDRAPGKMAKAIQVMGRLRIALNDERMREPWGKGLTPAQYAREFWKRRGVDGYDSGGGLEVAIYDPKNIRAGFALDEAAPPKPAARGEPAPETIPELTLGAVDHITTVYLEKLLKRIPSGNLADRAAWRREIEDLMAQMEHEGRKIAEHCVEIGGKFSVRG